MKIPKNLFLFALLIGSTWSYAQIPLSKDLLETGENQRRDLSTIGSRIVINPYDFGASPEKITPVVYSNRPTLPLNIAYLSTQNNHAKTEKRFGREYKNILLLFRKAGDKLEEAEHFQTSWAPYALPFTAEYDQDAKVEGCDYFYDDHTVIRSLNMNNRDKYVISGQIKGRVNVDSKRQTLLIRDENCKYAISFPGLKSDKLSFYANETDLKNGINVLGDDSNARFWAFEINGRKDLHIAVAYALNSDADEQLLAAVRKPFVKNDAKKAYIGQVAYWDRYLKEKVPHPLNFNLTYVDVKGVTSEDIRLAYYKAWVFLAQNVLMPEPGVFPYYQLVAGKASLWDEGEPQAPFSPSWESFVGMQFFAYIDPQISWSSLKGLLSLVDEEGMLGGESLPSRKAHSAWILYELSQDKQSLEEIYPALERYLNWRLEQPRWIYNDMTPENEKDAEFVVSVIVDLEYMSQIAQVLGKGNASKEWSNKRISSIENYKKWFWKTPQDLPVQHINHFKGRGTEPIQITTGLFVKELDGDHYESLLGLFYKYYNPEKSFGGFNAPKYPDVDFTLYGLIQRNKTELAKGLIETILRDIVRTHTVFAETYTNDDIPLPGGVRPSLFGMGLMIDFVLLKNGYMFTKGTPTVVNLFPDEGGVKGLNYLGKSFSIHSEPNDVNVEVESENLSSPYRIKVEPSDMKPIF